MNNRTPNNPVRYALDARLSGITEKPGSIQRVLQQAKGEIKVKKKLSLGFVLAIVLMFAAVTALAAVLTNYFSGFANLENTYGEYEQWPSSAKVELVQIMLDNGVIGADAAPQWKDISEQEKEKAAEDILAVYFSDMVYVDTYNAMARELGPIENWTDEERALYTMLLEKYSKLKTDWPVYLVPGKEDLAREQAVAQARDAVLTMFSITPQELDTMSIDAIFAIDNYNTCSASKDEPFWTVEFGYGMAYRVFMTRNGEMLGLMGPQTQFIAWGRNPMDGAKEATPGEHDASREEATMQARNALTEIMNVSYEAVDAMDTTANFIYSDLYCFGDAPVWLVTYSQHGESKWQVLLGYDGSYMDAEPAGKIFDQIRLRETTLADLCVERCATQRLIDPFFNAVGQYYYDWSLEEKAAYYATWADFANEYAASHPYFNGRGTAQWEWTRNISGLPDEQAMEQSKALAIAQKALEDTYDAQVKANEFAVFYYTTNPARPEWRFATPVYFVVVDARTGETMMVMDARQSDDKFINISDFLSYVFE